jgi:hypothetical protein
MEQAWASGIPTEYDTFLRRIFTIVAYAMILFGWITVSFLTVWIVRWILRS